MFVPLWSESLNRASTVFAGGQCTCLRLARAAPTFCRESMPSACSKHLPRESELSADMRVLDGSFNQLAAPTSLYFGLEVRRRLYSACQ